MIGKVSGIGLYGGLSANLDFPLHNFPPFLLLSILLLSNLCGNLIMLAQLQYSIHLQYLLLLFDVTTT